MSRDHAAAAWAAEVLADPATVVLDWVIRAVACLSVGKRINTGARATVQSYVWNHNQAGPGRIIDVALG